MIEIGALMWSQATHQVNKTLKQFSKASSKLSILMIIVWSLQLILIVLQLIIAIKKNVLD